MQENELRENEPAASDSVGQQNKLATKTEVAEMLRVSRRQVDNFLSCGLPHLRLGQRCVRFDFNEVRSWVRERFHTRRFGPARARGKDSR